MSKPPDPLPTLETTLLTYPCNVIVFSCPYCRRGGSSKVDACAAKFGRQVTLCELLYRFARGCPRSPYDRRRKPQKYGLKCGARIEGLDPAVTPYIPSMLALEIEEKIRRKRMMGW